MKLKFCTGCKTDLIEDMFYKNKARCDGYSNRCKECDKLRKKDPKNKEYYRQYAKEYQKTSARKEYQKSYYLQNKEVYRENSKNWRLENYEKQKELWRKSTKTEKWRKNHKTSEAKRRAIKKKAYVKGFDCILNKIYDNCPDGFQVDHIVPLKGRNVCGLHAPWNLQYLPSDVNFKKNNKLEDNCLQIPSLYEIFKEKNE